jgi:Ca2+-binding RTX toxin-like protein
MLPQNSEANPMVAINKTIPAINFDTSGLGLDVAMLRLHLQYTDYGDNLSAATVVWADHVSESNWQNSDSNWKHGNVKVSDLGYATVGDLLNAFKIDIDDAAGNRLILIAPDVLSATESEDGQRELTITVASGASAIGDIINSDKSVAAITNEDEADIYLRADGKTVTGFHIEGSRSDDTIKTGTGSDAVTASSGNDIINLGENGNQGNWWSDRDIVEYSGNLNVLNRSTGDYVKGYEVSQNEDGSVTVTDLLGTGLNDQGTDTLYGVEELQFGGDEWLQLGVRENIHQWGGADWRERRLNVDGGVFDDVIVGGVFNDDIRGKSGDDVIIADGENSTYSNLRISGGHAGDIARDAFGGGDSSKYDGFKDITLQKIGSLSKSFDGKQSRVNVYEKDTGNYETIDTNVAGDLYFYTNAVAGSYQLSGNITEAELAKLVADLRASDENTYAEIFVKAATTETYYLLDVSVDDTFRSGDWVEGGEGNDFIDGGLQGTSTENHWDNWNKSYYEGRSSNFEIKQVTYETGATSFNDGTLVSDYAALFSLAATNLGELIASLGFSVSKSTIASGDTITLVGDTTGELGLDVLKNVQRVGFSDRWINLDVTVEKNNWSNEGGYNIEGTIFSDLVVAGQNGLTEQYFSPTVKATERTWINTQAGNDIIVSGDTSDQINAGSGYDFVDAGANITGNDRWQSADEVRFDGSADRFDVEQISYQEALDYLSVEGRFALGDLSAESILGEDTAKTFFKVSDKAGSFGLGETVLSGVERLSFKGENLWTATSQNSWVNLENNNNDNDQEIKALRQDVNIDGTKFNDVVSLSDYKIFKTDADWEAAIVLNGRATDSDDAKAKIAEYTEQLHQFNVRLGDGDDVLLADTGHGVNVRLGAGDDLAIAVASQFKRADGAFDWITDSEVQFDGKKGRYLLSEIDEAGYILKDGTYVDASEFDGQSGEILFDLSEKSEGVVKNADGEILAQSSEITNKNGLVVVDRLPADFGGQGTDLIFGFEKIFFEDDDFKLETEINIRQPEGWLRGGVHAIDVRMKDSGGYFNALEALDSVNEQNSFSVADIKGIDGSDGNDFIVGSNYFNEMRLGSGDDVFVTLSSTGETDGVNSNPWDYYDKARFSGQMSRYDVDQVFVKVLKGETGRIIGLERDQAGQTVFYAREDVASDIYTAVSVVDKLGVKGDGSDILVGIDVLDFSDGRIEISKRFEVDINDRDYRGSFAKKFDVKDYVAPIYRVEGSIFDDEIIGTRPLDEDALFYGDWDSIVVDTRLVKEFIASGALDNIPVVRDWMQDGLSRPVGLVSEAYADPYTSDPLTLENWSASLYFKVPEGADPVLIKQSIEQKSDDFLDALTNSKSANLTKAEAQSAMVEELATLFYADGVTNVLELTHAYDGGAFKAISFPMLDDKDDAFMGPAYSDGEDRLIGGDGNDIIIGNGGVGEFEPGRGDDIIFGSYDVYDVMIDPYADSWHRDRVKIRAESDRFEISELYGFVDLTNHKIIGGTETLVSSADELGLKPQGSEVKKIFRVQDTIDVADLNLGTDYLIDVAQVNFQADNAYYDLVANAQFRNESWVPGVWDEVLNGKMVTHFDVWDTTDFSDYIDFRLLWQDPGLSEFVADSVNVSWDRNGEIIEGYQISGVNRPELGPGNDTFIGMSSPNFVDRAQLSKGYYTDYLFERKTDSSGDEYVEVKLSESSSVSDDLLDVTKLYDFDRIWLNEERRDIFLDTYASPNRFVDRGRVDFETSVFDDEITRDDLEKIKPTGFDELTWFNVKDSFGNDTVSMDWGFLGFYLGYGDDKFDGGHGADYVWTQTAPSNFEMSFVKQTIVDGEIVDVELDHATFVRDGIRTYHTSEDITGKYNSSVPIDDVIDHDRYIERYSAELFQNVDWRNPTIEGEPQFKDDSLGGPGWIEYNPGYYIKVSDVSANGLFGTDYYSNIEAMWFGDYLFDPVTNQFYDGSGNSGDAPYLANSYTDASDETNTLVLAALDDGDVSRLDNDLKIFHRFDGIVNHYDETWTDKSTATFVEIDVAINPNENNKTIVGGFTDQKRRVDLIDLIEDIKIKESSVFSEIYQTHIWEAEVSGEFVVMMNVTGQMDGKNTVARIILDSGAQALAAIENISTVKEFDQIFNNESIKDNVIQAGFKLGDSFDIREVDYLERWVATQEKYLEKDADAYSTVDQVLNPDPIAESFGGQYDLSNYNPHYTNAIADQMITQNFQEIDFSDGSKQLITWNDFDDDDSSNIVIGTPGKVSGRLLDDLKDGGVNFTNYANGTATSATKFSLSGFSFSGADDLNDDFKVSGNIISADIEIYGSSDLVLGSSPRRGVDDQQADITAISGEIYGIKLNGMDVDFSKIDGIDIHSVVKVGTLEKSETVLLAFNETAGDGPVVQHRFYLSGDEFGTSGQIVTNAEFETLVDDLRNDPSVYLEYPSKIDLGNSTGVSATSVTTVSGDSNLGFGTGHAIGALHSLISRDVLTEVATTGAETITAANGSIYQVNWSGYADSYELFLKDQLGLMTVGLLNNAEVQIAVRDEFNDGFGDDVYRGSSDFYGFDTYAISSDSWQTDTVGFVSSAENFEISVGKLNASGMITGLGSTHPLYGKVVGTANETYTKVEDLSSSDAAGFGTNYLFDIEMARFSNVTTWIGSALRFEDQNDRPDRIRLESYSSEPEFFDAQTDDVASSGFNRDDIDAGYYAAIQFDVRSASLSDKYFFGFDQLKEDLASDSWDFDHVRINDYSWNFEVDPVWFVRNADGKLVMEGVETPKVYDGSENLADGQYLVSGYVVSDNRIEGAAQYGDIYVSDVEVINFQDQGYNVAKEIEVEVGTHDLWLGDDNNSVDQFTWNRYNIDQQYGGLNYTFNGFEGATSGEIDKIRAIDIWSNGKSDDTIVIDTTNYKTSVGVNAGNDYVYLGSGKNADGSPNYSDISTIEIDDFSSRFEISRVWTILDENTHTPLLRSANDPASWITYNEAGAGRTEAILVKDAVGDLYGRKLIVGVGRIDFEDKQLNLRSSFRAEDWDNDGEVNRYRYEGTDFDDTITPVTENILGYVEDEMNGGGGNDTLVGGAGGDRLNGGQGDDVIFGGANGPNGNWHDNDRLTYWNKNFSDLEITKATVAVNYATYEVLRGASGEILRNVDVAALPSGYTAVLGTFVEDLVGGDGTDLLIDVEILETNNRGIELNAYSRQDDWDNDGVIDWSNIEGTEFNDLVNSDAFGEDFMKLDNDFNLRAGNDVVFGGSGGDNARLGAGNDVFIGGENGATDKWGWQRKDEARFENSYIRYDIESVIWTGSSGSEEIFNAEGDLAFVVNTDGEVFRFDTDLSGKQLSTRVASISDGDRLTVVTDRVPDIEGIQSDGVNLLVGVEYLSFSDKWMTLDVEYHYDRDEFGNIQGSWVNATEFSETLIGTDGRDHFNDGAGDDIVVGGLGGDHFNVDSGNDTIYGDTVAGSLEDGDHDSVRFDGEYEQFKLSVKTDESGRRYIEVQDLLPGAFGLGTNNLYDIENISFSNKWMNVGIRYDYFENWNGTKGTHINGSEFDDDIQGTIDGDDIYGGIGNDVLRGGDGADYFDGGLGNDTIYGGEEGLNPWGHKDVDIFRLQGAKTDYTVRHFDGSGLEAPSYQIDGYMEVSKTSGILTETDTLYGIERIQFDGSELNFVSANGFENGKWVWKGTDDAETKYADDSSQNERIYGYAGADTLMGGLGSDDLIGGDGDDVLYGNNSAFEADLDDIGIAFADTAVFVDKYSEVTISKITNTGRDHYTIATASEGTDTLHDVEIIEFTDRTERLVTEKLGRDRDRDGLVDLEIIYGTYADDDFSTGFGVDASKSTIIYGGAGSDTLSFNSSKSLRVYDDLGVNTYNASGDSKNDALIVDDIGSNWVGTDIEADTNYDGYQYEYKITNAATSSSTFLYGFERIMFDDTVINLKKTEETLDADGDGTDDITFVQGADIDETGTALDYSGHGNAVDVNGNAGDDVITGSNFDDFLRGGLGNDTISGGAGSDVFILDVSKSEATVSETENGFKVVHSNEENDLISDIEAIQFSDGKERLTILEEEIREYIYGKGFVTTQKVIGNNFDNAFTAGDKNKTITTGSGKDTITVDISGNYTLKVSDFDKQNDNFILGTDTNLSVAEFTTLQGGESELQLSSGARIIVNDGDGVQNLYANSSDYFIFDDEIFSGSISLASENIESTRIVISAPNAEETTWMQENVTSTTEKTTLNIGTGTVQIIGDLGSDTPLSDVLELI